jgi:hypothetical protein
MPVLTKEEAAAIGLQAESLSHDILKQLGEAKAQRDVALTALQMSLANVCVQMGVSFEDCMVTLAQNMPVFYKKQFARQHGEPAPVIDLSQARKEKA